MKSVRQRFDRNILGVFRQALSLGVRDPGKIGFFARSLWHQHRAALRRKQMSENGLEVPPLLIVSVTRKCNLHCKGCYAQLLHTAKEEELSPQSLEDILHEARELGVSIVMIAGGEPLLRQDLLEVAARFPSLTFPIFTNSTLLDAERLRWFARHPHLIPVISLEGRELETDGRRGDGVYQMFRELCPQLKSGRVFWGISLTLTRPGFALQMSEPFLREYLACGCRLFFFVEYVPVAEGSGNLTLTQEQKNAVGERARRLCRDLPGLFIAFPGDEEQYDGCLAAGRGFLHIDPSGRVEPCPFAPYSDTDLLASSLREALSSPLLRKIRQAHQLLTEGEGGCALWANREFIAGLQEPEQASPQKKVDSQSSRGE